MMLRYTVLLSAVLCIALYSEMAGKESLTPWVAGDISEPHAHLRANCRACHQPWQGPSPERCLACHVFALTDRRSAEGASGGEANPPGQPAEAGQKPLHCAECHQEHLDLPKLVKADLTITGVHQPGHPEHGTCMNCHTDADHGVVLTCAFCHRGDPTKTTEMGSHAGMKAK